MRSRLLADGARGSPGIASYQAAKFAIDPGRRMFRPGPRSARLVGVDLAGGADVAT